MSLSWVVFLNEKKNCVYRITLNCFFLLQLSRRHHSHLGFLEQRSAGKILADSNVHLHVQFLKRTRIEVYHPLNLELENQWLHRPNWRRPWKKLLGLNWRGFEENWRILLKIFEASNRNFFASGELFFKVPEDMKWKKWFNQSELVGTALLLCWTEQSFKLPEYSQLYLWSIFFVMLHCLSCIRILYK